MYNTYKVNSDHSISQTRRVIPRSVSNSSMFVWLFCVTCAGVLLVLPYGSFSELPPALVIWVTAGILFCLAVYSFRLSKRCGENPWITPLSLVMGFYFLRYGWGSLVVYYWDWFPWEAFTGIGQMFYRFGILDNLANACQLLLLGGVGFYLGAGMPARYISRLLPQLRWPISESKFRYNLVLYSPIALLIFIYLRWYLPLTIQFTVLLFGWIIWVMIVITSYWLFSAPSSSYRIKWILFLGLICVIPFLLGFFTGMGGHFLYPLLMVMLGYVLARGSLPWKFIIIAVPLLFFLILPWISLYKFSGDPGQLVPKQDSVVGSGLSTQSVYERISVVDSALSPLVYGARLELALERFVGRFTGSAMPAIFSQYYSDVYPFVYGQTFLIELSGLVPRVLWPEKPNVSLELNRYSVAVGILRVPDETSAVFDAISEYYINFGMIGVFLLSILHGYYLKILYNLLVGHSYYVIGASIYIVLFFSNLDFFGVGQIFVSHTRQIPVWLLLLYFMSKAPKK